MSGRKVVDPAYRELVEARWQRWYDVALTVSGDEHSSRTGVLATFMHLHEHWEDVESAPTDSGLRHLVTLLRSGTQAETTPDDDSPADPFEDESALVRRRLLPAYQRLDTESRLALALRCIEDLTDDEIARATGESGDQVARRIDSAVDVVGTCGPESWSRARVESELRDAVRWEAAHNVAGENPWNDIDLAIQRRRKRRRRVGALVMAAAVAAAVGVAAVAVTQQSDRPAAAAATETTTTSAPPLDPRSSDITRWPLRGSLAGRPDLLEPLRSTDRLSQIDGLDPAQDPVYIDRFVFAGDVGSSRFVIGYTPDLAGAGGADKIVGTVAFVGDRGAPLASLTPTLGGTASALMAIAHRPASRPGDLLVLGPDGQVPTRVSAAPIYHLDGTVTRTWTPLRFDHGVASTSLPATGPDSTFVRAETGESVGAVTAWIPPPGASGMPIPGGGVAAELVTQFASDQRLARSQITVLDQRTFRYRAPAERPFPVPVPGQNRIPGPSPTMLEVGWTATTVVMQRPDGTVFRSGRVEPDNNRGNSATQAITGAPTDARHWRGRPMIATEESQTGSRQPVLLIAPGAARVRFTGQNGQQISLTRIGDGVFRGRLAATGWFTDPLRVAVETYDSGGRRIGAWPLLTVSETDPLVEGETTGMVTQTR